MKQILRNHFCVKAPDNIAELITELCTAKSIYFKPLNRVMPARFFLCSQWGEFGALKRHFDDGNFTFVISKGQVSRDRIKNQLSKISIS